MNEVRIINFHQFALELKKWFHQKMFTNEKMVKKYTDFANK